MKRIAFTFLLVCISAVGLRAQDDLFPDYRSKRDQFKRLTEPTYKNELATFTMGGIDESMGKQPLEKLPLLKANDTEIVFGNDDIKVVIAARPFDPAKNKIQYFTGEDNKKYAVRINNKAFFGNYGMVPKTELKSIHIVFDEDTVALPKEAFSDIFNPAFYYKENGQSKTRNGVYLSPEGKRIYVYLLQNESGTGSFEATWIIDNRKYVKRVVDFGF